MHSLDTDRTSPTALTFELCSVAKTTTTKFWMEVATACTGHGSGFVPDSRRNDADNTVDVTLKIRFSFPAQ